MANDLYFRFDDDNKINYAYSNNHRKSSSSNFIPNRIQTTKDRIHE